MTYSVFFIYDSVLLLIIKSLVIKSEKNDHSEGDMTMFTILCIFSYQINAID